MPESFFIEPFTGIAHSLTTQNYLGIESIWNHQNYWVNMQDCREGVKVVDHMPSSFFQGCFYFVLIAVSSVYRMFLCVVHSQCSMTLETAHCGNTCSLATRSHCYRSTRRLTLWMKKRWVFLHVPAMFNGKFFRKV